MGKHPIAGLIRTVYLPGMKTNHATEKPIATAIADLKPTHPGTPAVSAVKPSGGSPATLPDEAALNRPKSEKEFAKAAHPDKAQS